jgi:putative redox protein
VVKVAITSVPGVLYRHELFARSHTIVSDVDTTLKGGDAGPTPHELFLMSLGTCTAMTMEMYAALKSLPVTKIKVTVTETTIADPDDSTKQIPHIVEDIQVEGSLTDKQIASLKAVGEKCPVYKLVTGKKVVETKVTGVATI